VKGILQDLQDALVFDFFRRSTKGFAVAIVAPAGDRGRMSGAELS